MEQSRKTALGVRAGGLVSGSERRRAEAAKLRWAVRIASKARAGTLLITSASWLAMRSDCSGIPFIFMSASPCLIPGNPDIVMVGVRIAIYIENLLRFIPAFWALVDGNVAHGELEALRPGNY
ncbi:hypothetical protein DFP72DRAFT_1040348 [Ephemerocybe angulata]|uniref:Uncharacterized protein n=1 Tax=Ephemerocybe angulata TaxID=980116 RepID=A0A8H6IFN7_9AGAR|nr:hypothetical protein DFP72DRAFT_1040348 [Tulosesus angulatus]